MWLKWFDAKIATEFGVSMAEYFAQRIPSSLLLTPDVKQRRKMLEVISALHNQTDLFRMNNKLNVYKTAKLANSFQWRLFDLGYEKSLVEELTKELLRDF